ncbi:MAG: DMT family transporter [Lachnospiraceae bacterium]|nr:DMT family transporter [Lachnospiraceae bacterium]
MSYFYMILLTILFSFGGITIKTSGTAFSPFMLSFLRFFIGVVLLVIIALVRERKIAFHFTNKIILLGGIAKAVNYLLENYGVMEGFSFGNVIVWPVQAVVALTVSRFLFQEEVTKRSVAGALLCVIGIITVSLNGTPLSEIRGEQAWLLAVFVVSGIGAALFTVSQKMLIGKVGAVEANLSMFLIGSVITLVVLLLADKPVQPGMIPGVIGPITGPALFSTTLLGAITGIGFLLQAAALKKIPVFMVTVIQSSTVILSLVWAVLFFHEPVTRYIVAGTLIFFMGILMVNIKGRR